jgi:hypothetical protein
LLPVIGGLRLGSAWSDEHQLNIRRGNDLDSAAGSIGLPADKHRVTATGDKQAIERLEPVLSYDARQLKPRVPRTCFAERDQEAAPQCCEREEPNREKTRRTLKTGSDNDRTNQRCQSDRSYEDDPPCVQSVYFDE